MGTGETVHPEFSEILKLSVSQKLQLVEDLWDDIATGGEAIPVADWQKEELAKRKANHIENPDSAVSWEEAKKRIRGRDG